MVPDDSQASGGKDSADAERTNLSQIYGDVLGLIHAPTNEADIGFHFYEGVARLIRKIQGATGRPLHQLWAAAEELRFLFDAHAVWLSVPEEYRQAPTGVDPSQTIWEVATLTTDEKSLIAPVRDGVFTQQLKRREAPGIRWDILDQALGGHPAGVPKNSNLAAVDSVLVVEVPALTSTPWQFAAFMEHHTQARETARQSTGFCEAIVPGNGDVQQAQVFRRALARIDLPFGPVGSQNSDDLDFWPVDRQGFQEESQQFLALPVKFCELYQDRFRSIHTILERIYEQMDGVLAAERRDRGAETTLIFSYRAPQDDFICFFPTVSQTLSFLRSKDDITDFLYYWRFRYYRSKAISGWVLATGACDYTEKFDVDGRWNEWINQCPSEERPRIERQLALVRKFFKTDQGHEQRFMYLVPIVLRPPSSTRETKVSPPQLQPILMASIGSSRPLAGTLRRQLYDLAWQIAPAVEMALFGQMTLEEVYRKEAEIRTVALFSAVFAHDLRQPLSLLKTTITSLRQTMATDALDPAVRESIREDLDRAQQSAEEIQGYQDDVLRYADLQRGAASRMAPLEVNKLVNQLVSKFATYLKVMMDGKIQIEATLSPQVGEIQADDAQVRAMIRNLLRNANEAFVSTGRGSGQIHVSTEVVDMKVRIKVQDNGPGMEQWVVEKLKHGERCTTKPLGFGLGFRLIDLSCKAHGGSFDIESKLGFGTSVVLLLPANSLATERLG